MRWFGISATCRVGMARLSLAPAGMGMATGVHANWVVWPTVAQMLTSPGPSSLWIITLPITLPMLAAIGVIEGVVAKWVLDLEQTWRCLTNALAIMNGVTSIIGGITMPRGTELWPGMLWAYFLTVVCEAPMLLLLLPKGEPRFNRDVWKASALMNAASYLFLLYIVLSVVELK